jgi:hypothetical protein
MSCEQPRQVYAYIFMGLGYTLTKVTSPESTCTSVKFNLNKITWPLHPSHSAWHFLNILIVLIIFVNSGKDFVFYFCIFSNKLDLLKATCSVILKCLAMLGIASLVQVE